MADVIDVDLDSIPGVHMANSASCFPLADKVWPQAWIQLWISIDSSLSLGCRGSNAGTPWA